MSVVEMPTESDPVKVLAGDCLEVLPTLPDGPCVDAVVCDPPYELGFMGKSWDRSGVAFDPATWAAVMRVLKSGGYMVAMGGSRTYHRMTCAVEDAGFEVRDCLLWLYGTGFPKGQGCLKPAYEPIVLARKPGPRVLPLGIDGCRVPTDENPSGKRRQYANASETGTIDPDRWVDRRRPETFAAGRPSESLGRYPANVLHDGSDEVMEVFAAFGEKTSGSGKRRPKPWKSVNAYGFSRSENGASDYEREGDTGTAARFFYCAKASRAERGPNNSHPTVKPLALMRWLVRLVCPPGGVVLDPFGGSGTTGLAALAEGRRAVLIEKHPPYLDIIRRRVAEATKPEPTGLFAGVS